MAALLGLGARALPFLAKAAPHLLPLIASISYDLAKKASGGRRRGRGLPVTSKWPAIRRAHVYATGGRLRRQKAARASHIVHSYVRHTAHGPVVVRGHYAAKPRHGGLINPAGRGRRTHHVKGHYRMGSGGRLVRVRAHRSR